MPTSSQARCTGIRRRQSNRAAVVVDRLRQTRQSHAGHSDGVSRSICRPTHDEGVRRSTAIRQCDLTSECIVGVVRATIADGQRRGQRPGG